MNRVMIGQAILDGEPQAVYRKMMQNGGWFINVDLTWHLWGRASYGHKGATLEPPCPAPELGWAFSTSRVASLDAENLQRVRSL